MTSVELVIIANGCIDETAQYLYYEMPASVINYQIQWFDDPIGYPKAINEGLKMARGDKIVLLNNDTVLLEQPTNQWLDILSKPFSNTECGISCIVKNYCPEVKREFAVFFSAMISKSLVNTIGLLDERFGVGSGEDIDYSIRAENAGFKVIQVFDKYLIDNQYTGGFPIYHVGEGTVNDKTLVRDWKHIYDTNLIKLVQKYDIDQYRYLLSNNYERAVFLKGDPIFPRESARYRFIADKLDLGSTLEIGCSTGYGFQFLPDLPYTGLDYDKTIVEVANDQDWGEDRSYKPVFSHGDVNELNDIYYDNIIAFEVIEHLNNGLEIVEKLKRCCNKLFVSVPWNEPKGFWGEHHKLHGLNESHFPDFSFLYIDQHGNLSDTPREIDANNQCNLMICIYEA